MSITNSMLFFFIMATLAALPSTSVALVVTRSANLGLNNGIAVAGGIVVGDLVFVMLALLGLSVVAAKLGDLFLVIKYPLGSLMASFLAGLFLTLGDVKAIVFYISLFPLFIETGAVNLSDIGIIVAITIITVGGIKITYAVTATKVANLPVSQTIANFVKRIAGGFMIAAGGYLIATA